jgi:TPP-dependent pyruvate/acetoin dehydrogenase alpha subunit
MIAKESVSQAMNKPRTSPMSEATLWHLYRRLLGAHLLEQRLTRGKSRRQLSGAAIAAALTENLLEGDSLGLAAGDLTTRYFLGMPLKQVRDAAQPRRGRRKTGGWALIADAEHGLLPGTGEEQASFAAGAALAARLHSSQAITVLFDGSMTSGAPGPQAGPVPAWERAAHTAVELQLPLLFISGSAFAAPAGPRKPAAAMPAIPVDRSDTLALYRVIYESAARARTGGGPTWIECSTWKVDGTPGDKAPLSPLGKMEEALRARKLLDRHQQRHIENALEKEFAVAGWPL